jgi:copper(I)-binding protein
MRPLALALLLLPTAALAGEVKVENPMVPLAPPGAMAHAAYMTLTNTGETPMELVGAKAEGYGMTHIHLSEVKNDIATMSAVEQVAIAPGQTVAFEHGGLHLMLMRPDGTKSEGDQVPITLEFSDGSTQAIKAVVMRQVHGHHGSHGS